MEAADIIEALTAQLQVSNELGRALEEDAGQLREDNARLRKLLTEAAADLTAYVSAEYPPDTCAQYPDIARRHFRDMELVRRIEADLNTGKEPSHE